MRAYSEEIEDAVHLTLDLYLSSASTLAATQRPSRTGAGTTNPSPLSTSPLTPTSPASPSEYSSQSSNRSGAVPTKFSQLPQHVFSPPPLGVSQWLTARSKGGSGKSKGIDSSNASRSSGSIYTDLSQLLTESKIILRRAEDERKAAAAKDTTNTSATTNGESSSVSQDRRRERGRIDEAKRNVQILRFSVQGDAPTSDEKTDANGTHAENPAHSSSRSSTSTNTSSTTILMNLSEATENVRARVMEDTREAQQQQQVSEGDIAPDHSHSPSLSSTPSSSIQPTASTDAPMVPSNVSSTTAVPGTATVTPSIPPPAAGVAAAAAVKAGKAVKTTRFLF